MGLKKKSIRRWKQGVYLFGILVLVVGFQNCTPARFESSRVTFISSLGDQAVHYKVVGNSAVVEGDIVLGSVQEAQNNLLRLPFDETHNGETASQRSLGAAVEQWKWPQGILYYSLQNYPFDTSVILTAIERVNETGIIQMRLRTNQANYIQFVNGEHSGDCRSYIGRKGGMQELWLGSRCLTSAIVMHEIGHAAGLAHEHSRRDRDQHIQVNYENVDPGYRWALDRIVANFVTIGNYDYASLMHYGMFDFSFNGRPVIVPKVSGVTIGQQDGYSLGDLKGLLTLYPQAYYQVRSFDAKAYKSANPDLRNMSDAAARNHWLHY